MGDTLTLIYELFLLLIGIYFFLFSIGRIRFRDPAGKAKADAFRKKNGTWLGILSFLLILFMGFSLFLHLRQLLAA